MQTASDLSPIVSKVARKRPSLPPNCPYRVADEVRARRARSARVTYW